MTNQDLLIQTVLQAKCYLMTTGSTQIDKSNGGGDIDSCQIDNLFVLNAWIEVLERYNCQFYITTTEDNFECLTEAEAMALIAKVKVYIGT
jgi:hypothetical protein